MAECDETLLKVEYARLALPPESEIISVRCVEEDVPACPATPLKGVHCHEWFAAKGCATPFAYVVRADGGDVPWPGPVPDPWTDHRHWYIHQFSGHLTHGGAAWAPGCFWGMPHSQWGGYYNLGVTYPCFGTGYIGAAGSVYDPWPAVSSDLSRGYSCYLMLVPSGIPPPFGIDLKFRMEIARADGEGCGGGSGFNNFASGPNSGFFWAVFETGDLLEEDINVCEPFRLDRTGTSHPPSAGLFPSYLFAEPQE